jgi:hypothetical protein
MPRTSSVKIRVLLLQLRGLLVEPLCRPVNHCGAPVEGPMTLPS